MKQNNKKFNNAMHKFVGVLDKYGFLCCLPRKIQNVFPPTWDFYVDSFISTTKCASRQPCKKVAGPSCNLNFAL